MRRLHLMVPAILAALALAGCLASGPAGLDPTSGDLDLALTVEANRSDVRPGQVVGVAVAVENRGDEAATYRQGCDETWDLAVLDGDGDEVAHRRPIASCDGFQVATLEPGEELRLGTEDGFTWNATVWNGSAWVDAEAGTYQVRALFGYELDGQAGTVAGNDTLEVGEAGNDDADVPDEEAPGRGSEEGAGREDPGSGDAEVETPAEADRDAIAPGETVHVNLTAGNVGEETVRYRSGCGHTWEVSVVDEEGEEIQAWRSWPRCQGFSKEPFEPGETVPYPGPETRSPLTWNGTAWDGESYAEVEPGNYTIQGTFPYYPDERSDARDAEASVTVRVTG